MVLDLKVPLMLSSKYSFNNITTVLHCTNKLFFLNCNFFMYCFYFTCFVLEATTGRGWWVGGGGEDFIVDMLKKSL